MAPLYTQKGRPMRVETPLPTDTLLLERIECDEGVSEQYEIVLDLLSTDQAIDPKKLLRQPVTAVVSLTGGGERYFNGIVKRFVQLGKSHNLVSYRAEVVPRTWLLSLASDCRIFQQKSVPDIVKAVLNDLGITDVKVQLSGQYSPREYCVHEHPKRRTAAAPGLRQTLSREVDHLDRRCVDIGDRGMHGLRRPFADRRHPDRRHHT